MSFITVRGKKLYFQDRGEGFPLLFGHSYLWSSKMWQLQLDFLSKHFRCIATDLWDHGISDHLGEEFSLESCAEEHWQLMQHLEVDEFAMIGLSVGGMWGTHLALQHPEAVKALVLMDTFVGSEPSVSQKRYFNLLDKLESDGRFTPEFFDLIAPMFFSPHTFQNQKELVDNFRKELLAVESERIPGIVEIGRKIFSRADLLPKLSTIEQPSLVIVGRDDLPRPPKESELMAESLPHATLQIVENAGHISNLEQIEEVNSLLFNFIQTVSQKMEVNQ
ncbi:MAG: alpha/beta hydrolase [Candidatus Algichlamydia australiensis]|nr:alpha/beta hydrolase [Chlamydiales bacterium]